MTGFDHSKIQIDAWKKCFAILDCNRTEFQIQIIKRFDYFLSESGPK